MFKRISKDQQQQRLTATIQRQHHPSNEEIIFRLKSELAATKLHLQAEAYGRIAACNELEIANSRIDQLRADNCELRSQLQQSNSSSVKHF